MKIVFLMQDTGSVYGAERATMDLAEGLRGTGGTDVHVLLIEERRLGLSRSTLREALSGRGLPSTALATDRAFSWTLVHAIRDALRETRADVLHTVGYKADVHGGLAAGWGKVLPVVSTVHGWLFRPYPKELFYGWINVLALKRFSAVIALSRFYENILITKGVSRERVFRIPTGVDIAKMGTRDAAPPGPDPSRPLVVGILGRLSSEKNHQMFLRAAKRVQASGGGVRFVIAGDGPLRAKLEATICQLSIGESVTMMGYADSADFFPGIHVLALCSRIENLPYSVLEAMAWRRPVIATRVGGLPELVEEGKSGLLVPPDSDGALATAIRRFRDEPELISLMGRVGHERLEEEFSLSATLSAHRNLYAAVTGGLA